MNKMLCLCYIQNSELIPIDLGTLTPEECRIIAKQFTNNAEWLNRKADLIDELNASIKTAINEVTKEQKEEKID